jgi:hypothetical protein
MELRLERLQSGGELETMPEELSSETEKTVSKEGVAGVRVAGSAGNDLSLPAGLEPGCILSV